MRDENRLMQRDFHERKSSSQGLMQNKKTAMIFSITLCSEAQVQQILIGTIFLNAWRRRINQYLTVSQATGSRAENGIES